MARIWEHSQHGGSELLMLLAIGDFADDDGRAYPAVITLAEKCRMKTRNANYVLAALRASGELEIHQNEGPHSTNLYKVVVKVGAIKQLEPLQPVAPLHPAAPLHCIAHTPALHCPKPLRPIADKPSLNHQEPLLVKSSRPKKQSRLPENFQPNTTGIALAEKNGLNLEGELNAFKNHHTSKGSLFLDWQAAWRTWVGNAVKFNANSSKRTGSSRHTGFDQPNYYGDLQDGIPD